MGREDEWEKMEKERHAYAAEGGRGNEMENSRKKLEIKQEDKQ